MIGLDGRVRWARMIVAAATVALALGAAACGSEDDDGGGGATAAGDTASGDAGGPASADPKDPEAQIRAAFAAYVDSVFAGDYEKTCGLVSSAQHRILRKMGGKCERQFRTLLGGEPPGSAKPRIVKLQVKGNKAKLRALTEGDAASRPLDFVRERGEWKVASGVATDPGN